MRVYVISFFALVLFAVAVGILFADSKQLAAQSADEILSSSRQGGFVPSTGFEEVDIVAAAFPMTPRGCGKRAAFFTVAKGMYYQKTKLEQISAQAKMFEPLFADVYKKLDKHGPIEATVKNMEEYIDCIKGAEKIKDSKDAKEEVDLHETCVGVTEFALDVVNGVKNRREKESLIAAYERKEVNFEGTPYERFENADEMLINKIYDLAKGDYDAAVETAGMISLGCYNK
ncbi:MAG: hypothetical protein OEY94_03100 [Alphaproteobacteria bacterium]|nr:hypothetical protein [Alphaproteobacteria bacterium]